MIDATTPKPLKILIHGTADPYIRLPFAQLAKIRRLFDEQEIRYTGDDHIISIDGGPEMAIIDLGRGANVPAVQAILDDVR